MTSSTAPVSLRALPAALLALIGGVFVLKYSVAVVAWPAVAAAGFAVAYGLGLAGVAAWARARPHHVPRATGLLLASAALGAGALLLVSPDAPAVAREPAIREWLGALGEGRYPYGQPSLPSGLPGLFALAAPFWATGTLDVLPLVGLGVGMAAVWRLVPHPGGRLLAVAATAALPAVAYEILVTSELFTNLAFVLAALLVAEHARARGGAWVVGAGVALGWMLSTRVVVALVVVVYGAYALRRSPGRAAGAAVVAAAVFAALLLPFVVWEPARFAAVGPFHAQGRFLPTGAALGAGTAAIALGATARDVAAVVRRSGVLLTLTVTVALAWTAGESSWSLALWGDHFDVSYFVLGVPFLVASLARAPASYSAPAGAPWASVAMATRMSSAEAAAATCARMPIVASRSA